MRVTTGMTAMSHIKRSLRWRTDGMRAYVGACRATAGWDRYQRVPLQLPAGERLPVIFCTWRRLERLPKTLAMLAAQDVPVQALIWDNSGDRETVDKAVADSAIPIAVHHSGRNIGGFGRFYLAREAAAAGHKALVFVDDDQDFGPEALAALQVAHRPRTLSGWWAWHILGRYGDRKRAHPGEPADYVGTGGMIADAAIFRNERLFSCPRRFWFAEDLWLCSFARSIGYQILACEAGIEEIADGRNQNNSLGWVKQRLWRRITRRG
jgi:hypothetical protein